MNNKNDDKQVKEIIVRFEDGTEETAKEGMLIEVEKIGYMSSMQVRHWGFDKDDLDNYLIGIVDFVAKAGGKDLMKNLMKHKLAEDMKRGITEDLRDMPQELKDRITEGMPKEEHDAFIKFLKEMGAELDKKEDPDDELSRRRRRK